VLKLKEIVAKPIELSDSEMMQQLATLSQGTSSEAQKLAKMLESALPAYHTIHDAQTTEDKNGKVEFTDPRVQNNAKGQAKRYADDFARYASIHSNPTKQGEIEGTTNQNRTSLDQSKEVIRENLNALNRDFTTIFTETMGFLEKKMPQNPPLELKEAHQLAVGLYNKWNKGWKHTNENKELCVLAMKNYYRLLEAHIQDSKDQDLAKSLINECSANQILVEGDKETNIKTIKEELSKMFGSATKMLAVQRVIHHKQLNVHTKEQIKKTNQEVHALFEELSNATGLPKSYLTSPQKKKK